MWAGALFLVGSAVPSVVVLAALVTPATGATADALLFAVVPSVGFASAGLALLALSRLVADTAAIRRAVEGPTGEAS